jgi:hypothetical protein
MFKNLKNIFNKKTESETKSEISYEFIKEKIGDYHSSDESLFSDNLIRKEEEKINFTKKGIIDLSLELLNPSLEFNKFYDKENMKLYTKLNGSLVSDQFVLGKCEYKLYKKNIKEGVTVKNLIDYVNLIKFRCTIQLLDLTGINQ